MESMTIHLISLVNRDGQIHARARATAEQARITVEVWFEGEPGASKRDLWREARDRVLAVLDPA